MTKREMVEEIIAGLKYTDNERVIKNRCEQPKWRVQQVYDYYQTTKMTKEDKIFCINLLIKW